MERTRSQVLTPKRRSTLAHEAEEQELESRHDNNMVVAIRWVAGNTDYDLEEGDGELQS